MSTDILTKDQFERAVTQYGLTEQEPIIGDRRRHFSNTDGVWGVREGEGRQAQFLLYVPAT